MGRLFCLTEFNATPGRMMGSCNSEEEEEDRFFDTREDITSISDSGSDCPEKFDLYSSPILENWVLGGSRYEVWIENPGSVNERRHKFLKWMGLGLDQTKKEDSDDLFGDKFSIDTDRITENGGAVLRNADFEGGFLSSRSSMSYWSNDSRDLSTERALEENFVCRIRNLDDGTEYIVDELGQDGMLSSLREVGSDRLVSFEEFQSILGLSPSVPQIMQRDADEKLTTPVETRKRVKKSWLRRFCFLARILVKRKRGAKLKPNDSDSSSGAKVRRVRVRPFKKRSKEISALYMGQEIHAHDGSILTMKFSPEGQYLASAGEDGIVRVWQVIESERSIECEIPDIDPSCVYLRVNHFSELAPLFAAKEKLSIFKGLRKTSESACVVFPPSVIRISEKPLHEFHGHNSEILDLSWSKNKHLLSSSVDKTVRLWRVGHDQCLKVFSHNNYVTSVQFNPIDDNYFISGSIDGKVRIWEISGCQVVDWTDIKEIVTAVCYRPDGQGGIIGSMNGNCHFYNISDNHLQVDAQICLEGKKKFPGNRITGFQFSPSDPSKLMVTSADSQIRILDGVKVISKYKGLRNSGSQISASFTLDGKHIISASEDSNVYVWNYGSHDRPAVSPAKNIWSCERFFSSNVSVAIPWCGWRSGNSVVSTTPSAHQVSGDPLGRNLEENRSQHYHLDDKSSNTLPLSSPDCFSLGPGCFAEALPKGSATWPEEKLPTSTSLVVASVLCKSHYRFLKNSCQSTLTSPHAWCLVIVTAGWDGRIRSFQNYGLPVHL
ncbi:WD40 repeat [Macleaya cordata]|uniref:WD40 repeat n=1 Tax=Macleaya cordata TaxID=56857 RepID=A0A200QWB6_MACCD|nr:WD40 repeat [Macleaya cordata]